MSQACTACNKIAPGESGAKGAALVVGAIVFCPCHLPATLAASAALGGGAWLVGHSALLYSVFGLIYLLTVVLGVRYIIRLRDAERRREAEHSGHGLTVPGAA